MVGVAVVANSKTVTIAGHGIKIDAKHELTNGVIAVPSVPSINIEEISKSVHKIHEYAAIISMADIATFSLEVESQDGGQALAAKAWNALWDFHYLSIACSTPCFSLYSVAGADKLLYTVANRNFVINPLPKIHTATESQFQWALAHRSNYEKLQHDDVFKRALLCFTNAHYLFDNDMRTMLLWAGIEGLLSVNGEQRRRLALYSSLLFDGTDDDKYKNYQEMLKAYDVRSKVVHGSKETKEALSKHYEYASKVLVRLLAKCVELGFVPTPADLDAAAVSLNKRIFKGET